MAKNRGVALELPPSVEPEPIETITEIPTNDDVVSSPGKGDDVSELPGMVVAVNAGVQEIASVTIPLGPGPTIEQIGLGLPPYSPRELSIKRLSARQRRNLVRVQAGLMATGAVLENGTPVSDLGHAVRYFLEQLG